MDVTYDSAAKTTKYKLDKIQNEALRLATEALTCTSIKKLEIEANILPLQSHREYHSLNYGIKILSDIKHPTRDCLVNHNEFIYSNDKPFARRLYELGIKYKINLNNIDNKCNSNIPPWEKPKFNINLTVHSGPEINSPIELLKEDSLKAPCK